MTAHRFQIGEIVAVPAWGVPPGPYRIRRLMPLADGVPQYRVVSTVDRHERLLFETAVHRLPQRPSGG